MATPRKSPARAHKLQAEAKTRRPPGILVRFRSENAWNSVSRELLKEMARRLNMNETDTVHMALADRARALGLLPRREPTLIESPEDLAGFDLSGLKRVLQLGLKAEAEDRAKAERAEPRARKSAKPIRKAASPSA